MTIRVLGLDHLVLRARDLPRMIRFYCEVLGLTLERRRDDLGLVQLRAGRALLDLVTLDGPLGRAGGAQTEGRNLDHLCLRIEAFDATALAQHLRVHGIEPGEVGRRYGAEGYGPSMYVRDPDGNTVELKGPPESAQA